MRLLQVLYQLHCSEITDTDAKDNGRQWLIPITDPIIGTSLTTSFSSMSSKCLLIVEIRGTSMVQMDDNGRRIASLVSYLNTYRLSNQQVQVVIIFLIMEISWPSNNKWMIIVV